MNTTISNSSKMELVSQASHFVSVLNSQRQSYPNKAALNYLVNGGLENSVSISYQELDLQARIIAQKLSELYSPQSRILLLFPSGNEFIITFVACLYARMIAVPCVLPGKRDYEWEKTYTIYDDCQPDAVFTVDKYKQLYSDKFAGRDCNVISFDDIDFLLSDSRISDPTIDIDDIAFLQYTSGSTGNPKGVVVSHQNLFHHLSLLQSSIGLSEKDVLVHWLPLFHDMGLVATLTALFVGKTCHYMSPTSFLQRPVRWLQAMSFYKATITTAPNFSYELCVQRVDKEQLSELDLSSLKHALNGAEPVRLSTVENFFGIFSACGLVKQALKPVYGMAETTLLVTIPEAGKEPVYRYLDRRKIENGIVDDADRADEGVQSFVSAGVVAGGQRLLIVDPETKAICSKQQVGEIWVQGGSVAQGYWKNKEKTEETFQAFTADTNEGPFLRTGDLGFLDSENELYIASRLKDMIIIRGLNYYPQDIEQTVNLSHEALSTGAGAAFSINEDDEEKLVVVHEVSRSATRNLNLPDIVAAVRQSILERYGLQLYAMVLIAPRTIPKTSSGKVKRWACRDGYYDGSLKSVGEWSIADETSNAFAADEQKADLERVTKENAEFPSVEEIQQWLIEQIASMAKTSPESISVDEPFSSLGMDSVLVVELSGRLEEKLGCEYSPTLIYDYPSIASLSRYIVDQESNQSDLLNAQPQKQGDDSIAIIGMACRFPGAETVDEYWKLLEEGVNAVSPASPQRFGENAEKILPGGFLKNVDMFDAAFFGIAPIEAEAMDPQQRLMLEVVWEALENSAIAPDSIKGSQTGIFLGASAFDYAMDRNNTASQSMAYMGTGSSHSILANRISYFLDTRGPSLAIDTACSSSLVAVHYASRSLKHQESDIAIAGGVNLIVSPAISEIFSTANMLSEDGRCKTFDAQANGYVRGEGCGVVILKRTEDALRDGDNILALVSGSAVNQDGRSNGLTAPNGPSQQAVVKQALASANISPSQISYVETHGTGTPLGDPIELNSLANVLMQDRKLGSDSSESERYVDECYVGSVKTNIGHLEAAAGIAGLIKTVLSLRKRKIPQHLHFDQLNPEIKIAGTSIKIPASMQDWDATSTGVRGEEARFAGVSSFGFGGTNSHVILSEYVGEEIGKEKNKSPEQPASAFVFPLSAKSQASLDDLIAHYADYFLNSNNTDLLYAYQVLSQGRSHFDYRAAIVASDHQELLDRLSVYQEGRLVSAIIKSNGRIQNKKALAFLFSGQGCQYLGMGKELYETQAVFRDTFNQCQHILSEFLDKDISNFILHQDEENSGVLSFLINQTDYTQPLLFAFEYSLAQLWMSWGIKPAAVFGHSIGEYVAACIAGVFSLSDGLKLAALRGRLMQSVDHEGGMVAVFSDEVAVKTIIEGHSLSIAAINSPKNIVISGELTDIEAAVTVLRERGIRTERLSVSQAFHSELLSPIVDEFREVVSSIVFNVPTIPIVSGLTGKEITAEEISSPEYWCQQSIQAVNFFESITTLLNNKKISVFLEIGPRPVLSNIGKQCQLAISDAEEDIVWLPSLIPNESDNEKIAIALANLYLQGQPILWQSYIGKGYIEHHPSPSKQSTLPNYPFQRQRYWIDPVMPVTPDSETSLAIPEMNNHQNKIVNKEKDLVGSKLENSIIPEDIILVDLTDDISAWSGIDNEDINIDENLFYIGVDSLILMKAKQKIENDFKVDIEMGQFYDKADTLRKLATHIYENMPNEDKAVIDQRIQQLIDLEKQKQTTNLDKEQNNYSAHGLSAESSSNGSIEALIQLQMDTIAQQNKIMQLQLESLNGHSQSKNIINNSKSSDVKSLLKVSQEQSEVLSPKKRPATSRMQTSTQAGLLTSQQQQFIDQFCPRFNQRTNKSKQFAEKTRPILSDRIASMLFNKPLKELIYPVVCQYSEGQKVWDIDGNEYIDIAMGYGTSFFGHNPPFAITPMEQQLKDGFHLGPQFELAGKVAQMISDMTGLERVTFSNTGTEAVMSALRIARCVTSRDKIVIFENSYHGTLDSVLAMPSTKGAVSIAPGIPQNLVDDIIILKYNDPSSLETIRSLGKELAGVLVEPVQTRVLDWPDQSYIQQLRQVTDEIGAALIFDEVVTGFRLAPGGAQEVFGVQADIALYGKLLGGGMPNGVIAGSARFMDAIDGGGWNYGDDSIPQKVITVFGGTFCKHPLAMVAMHSVLLHLQEKGPDLQKAVSDLTDDFIERINTIFAEFNAPLRAKSCGPIFRFDAYGDFEAQFQAVVEDLFFYLLMEKGVYSWEGRICNFSTVHTPADVDAILKAVRESVTELSKNGFFQKSSSPLLGQQGKWDGGASLVSGAKEFPASSAQRRLYVLNQFEGASIAYHVIDTALVEGALDLEKLKRCLKKIILRHESLRTGLVERNGEIVQFIVEDVDVVVEQKYATEENLEGVLKSFFSPFDLAKPPLFKMGVVHLSLDKHLIVWDAHHIVFDGMSGNILMQELLSLYDNQSLPVIKKQFRQHVEEEKLLLHSDKFKRAEGYWLDKFQDGVPPLDFITDYQRPKQQSFSGDTVVFSFEGEELESLRKFVKQQNASVFIGLFAAYYLFLNKITTQESIVVGLPTIGRFSEEFDNTIGMFVNTLAVKEDVLPKNSIAEFIDQLKQNLLQSFDYESYPFESLVDALKVPRDMGRNAIFDTMFSYEKAWDRELSISGLNVSEYDFRPGFSMVDLSLEVIEKSQSIKFYLSYCTDIFAKETVISYAECYKAILLDIVANANKSVAEAKGISGQERERILLEKRVIESDYPKDQCFHQLFETQVEKTPDAIAVACDEQSLTYAELNCRANQVAHYLINQGVKPDALVGLCVNRSVDMLIAILGVWKSGSAYVPVDPDYPVERKQLILSDASVQVILSQSGLMGDLPTENIKTLYLDSGEEACGDKEVLSSESEENIPLNKTGLQSNHLAYVIYTSGSTGVPKGVMVEHRALVNFSFALANKIGFDQQTINWGLNASLSFDASLQAISTLLFGSTVTVLSTEIRTDIHGLTKYLVEKNIHFFDCTPSQLKSLLPELSAELDKNNSSAITLVVGGEKLDEQTWQTLSQEKHIRCFNVYGPTESTIDATLCEIIEGSSSSIGQPLNNIQAYVVDSNLSLLPTGIAGELLLGGDSLARGYLNRSELTAERFIANPFGDGSLIDSKYSRLYKTGDLVRWLPDGNLEFIGRIDDQMKIRGHRIELGEIESQLINHKTIEQSAVLAREDIPGDKRLVAYIVLAENVEEEGVIKALRDDLLSVLPEYMVPSAYVILETLPLTTNGKINRKALPAPEASDFSQQKYVAPRTQTEKILATIWSDLLQLSVDAIGVHDSFFTLGGHSLLAIQLLSRLQEQGKPTNIRGILSSSTLEQLATYIDQSNIESFVAPENLIPEGCAELTPSMLPLVTLSQAEIDVIVATVPGGVSNIQDIYPLAPLQEGILFHHLLDPVNDPYRVCMPLQIDNREQLDNFIEALQFVVNRHDILRTSFLTEGVPAPVQVVWRKAELQVEELSESEFQNRKGEPLDLNSAPVLRLSVAPEISGQPLSVLLHYHHLLYDQLGMALVESEAFAYLSDNAEQLPAPAPFRDFVAQALHQSEELDAQTYFESLLGDIDEPSLCFDIEENNVNDVEEKREEISSKLAYRIREVAQRFNYSPATLFHAAWGMVVAASSGRDDVVFGTVLSGRLQGVQGSERMLGMFINTLPLRLELGQSDVNHYVAQTDRHIKELLNYEQVPLTLTQGASGVGNEQSLFNSLFNYRYIDKNVETNKEREKYGIAFDEGTDGTHYPLSISIDDLGKDFAITVNTSKEIGAARVVEYLQNATSELVDALLNSPEQTVQSLFVLPEAEYELQVKQWNATSSEYPHEKSLHQLFETQVEEAPSATAVVFGNQQLTYTELNQRANQVAHYLVEQGITPDTLIGLCVERSIEMVVGILGIVKAGGAYVPLDPVYPLERLEYMLADADISLVLSQSSLQNSVPKTSQLMYLDDDKLLGYPANNLNRNYSPSTLAYVIYTSGSTGQPKGVEIEQKSIVRLVCQNTWADFNKETNCLLHSSISFDAATYELWAPLLNGGRLVVYSDVGGDVVALSECINTHEVNSIFITSGLFAQWLEDYASLPSLRHLMYGGEVISSEIVNAFYNNNKQLLISHVYGPTENTTFSTSYNVPREFDASKALPIGKPISQSTTYVLNSLQQPVPIGATGELYVGGSGLARGYLNRPELTAEKFIANPFSDNTNDRLYRTGDLVRWLPDGNLEFIGRVDDQVKIRGYRIELGEIESQLLAHDLVEQGVVLAREDVPGDKRLVAYAVLNNNIADETLGDNEGNVSVLRDDLSKVLPSYMVPSAYVILESLPLTVNGKVNRKALPIPEASDFSQTEYVAPETETEQILVNIWSDLLQIPVDKIGRHDNFFALGGHSLLVIQLLSRLQAQDLHADIRGVFASPTLAQLASYIEEQSVAGFEAPENLITDDCTELTPELLPLVHLTQAEIDTIIETVPGGVANIQDIYPLAPLQEGILFHHLLDPDNDPYQVMMPLRVDSKAQLNAFIEALQQVVNRHDILRTAFITGGVSSPVQVVWREAALIVDNLSEADFTAQQQQGVTLDQAPVLRISIAPEVEGEPLNVLLTYHHLLYDQMGMAIVESEAMAYLSNTADQLPAPAPFRQFVAHARHQGDNHNASEYFQSRLGDIEEPTLCFNLSESDLSNNDPKTTPETRRAVLPNTLNTAIRHTAHSRHCTPATLFHAAWAMVAAASSGREDVVFGTVLSGRLQGTQGADRMLGMFINTLPLRLNLNQHTVEDFLSQTDLYLKELLSYEQASLTTAQGASGVGHEQALFNSLLNYRYLANADAETQAREGFGLHIEADDSGRTNYPISVSIDDLGNDFAITVQTIKDVGAQRVIGYLHEAIQQLTAALAATPQQAIQQLSVLPQAEQARQLVEWNATASDYPQDQCLHQLFEAQVERTPETTAVIFGDDQLNYTELNQRSNQVAHYLLSQGVRPDTLVGLCIERSIEMVVGILGIVKAGGAYVPLDPVYPSERLSYMLEDAGISLILSHSSLSETLPLEGQTVIYLDTDTLSDQPVASPSLNHSNLMLSHLAYVIYTSGSTGQPKGVEIEQKNIVRLVCQNTWADFNQNTVSLLHSSISFDAATYELWAPLLNGGCVVVYGGLGGDVAKLSEVMYDYLVNSVFITSGLFAQWTEENIKVPSLRHLMYGGQVISSDVVSLFYENNKQLRISHVYGPTENTTFSTSYDVPRDFNTEVAVPIGQPISQSTTYVLNAAQQPVPVGAVGELYVGGDGLARGYLNRSKLTAEKFIANPFSDNSLVEASKSRLYKTGDLVRWLSDGNLEFIGRIDDQVKIRGYRIELGEIETQLLAHASVEQGVVLAREDSPGEKRLVAYIVLDVAERDNGVSIVRDYLSSVLPNYMLPSAYVVLDDLPLTVNGKVNRKVLPAPNSSDFLQSEYVAPETEIENILVNIWSDLLQLPAGDIGIHDNFFALGGHSLLVVQLISRLQEHGYHIDIQRVFEAATLGQLAKCLEEFVTEIFVTPENLITPEVAQLTPDLLPLVELSQSELDTIVATVPGGVENIQDIYPLAPLQEGILFHHLMDPEKDPYQVAMHVRVDTWAQLNAFVEALQKVIDRHDILRTSFVSEGISSPVQVVWREAKLVVEHLNKDDFLSSNKEPLQLTQAPVLRVSVAPEVSGEPLSVLLSYHHLLYDQVGMEIVESEAMAYLSDTADQLPAPAPFRDFVAHALHQSQMQDAQVYFESRLGEVNEPTLCFQLTGDSADAGMDECREELSLALGRKIRKAANTVNCSAATLFHVAWALVASSSSGRDDVVFGTVLSGRLQGVQGADRMLGMFINTLPLRLVLTGSSVQGFVQETDLRIKELLSYEQTSLTLAQGASSVGHEQGLFNSLFNYRHLAGAETESQAREEFGIYIDMEDAGRTNYPLTISIDDLGEGFAITARVSSQIGADRVVAYVEMAIAQLAESLLKSPETLLQSLSVVSKKERVRQLSEWNATRCTFPLEKCIHELFEEQVDKTPDAIAIAYKDQSLSYAALNARANQVAHYLLEQGVQPDSLVGLCTKPSLEVMIGIFGIMKSGAAYVPLDPAHPEERLRYVLSDADISLVLTQSSLAGALPDIGQQEVYLDTDSDNNKGKGLFSRQAIENPLTTSNLTSTHLAYVLYTSGSTGQPKGVALGHSALTNYVYHIRLHHFTEETQAVVSNTLSFDATVTSLFPSLICGGSTRFLSVDDNIINELAESIVTGDVPMSYKMTPSHAAALCQYFEGRSPSVYPHTFVIGGEQLLLPLTKTFLEKVCPQATIIHHYGPTEAAVGCTTYPLAYEGKILSENVANALPIGKPISNSTMYILDSQHKLVPTGAPGELYIGGECLARGYLNRPELTLEKFIPDMFSNEPLNDGSEPRLYKTGDLVRWLPDGNLEFMGRVDDQVKIRGHRIELGEIEAQLLVNDYVDQGVVLVREDVPGDKRLVVYIVLSDDVSDEENVTALREHLSAVLPSYMVPSAYVVLNELPLMVNGKVNRKALPAPDSSDFKQSDYIAPETETEKALVKIWSDLLQLSADDISVHDNFFALGGHSLLVIQLLSCLQAQGKSADIRGIFDSPTLRQLANYIDQSSIENFIAPDNLIPVDCTKITPEMLPLVDLSEEEIETIVANIPGGVENIQDIYPLAPLQEGILFHHVLDPQNDPYCVHMPLQVDSRAQLKKFAEALQFVINRHDILRTAFLTEGLSSPVQVVLRKADLQVEELGKTASATKENEPLDLTRAPILRLSVAPEVSGQPLSILLSYHHLLYDQVGMAVVESEAFTYLSNQSQSLPEPAPFREFVAHALHQSETQDAKAYFESRLGDIDEPHLCFGVSEQTVNEIEENYTVLPSALSNCIREIAQARNISPAALFHAAWGLVVSASSGQEEAVFGTVLSGRLQGLQGSERMLGMFINTLPVRLDVGEFSAEEFVNEADHRLKELLSYEQAPLTLAQGVSGVGGGQPLFNSLLNYRYSADSENRNDAVIREAFGIHLGINKETAETAQTNYPLTISIDDMGQDFAISAQVSTQIGVDRVVGYLSQAISQLVELLSDPPQSELSKQSVQQLSLLPDAERKRQLNEWNATASDYPGDQCIHQLFEAQVVATPDNIAVTFADKQLTYKELNTKANQVAHYLIEQGVQPDTLVGLCIERSLEMVIGILGILKAGGAYVPLDPVYPAERLSFMLEDAEISLVLSQTSLISTLSFPSDTLQTLEIVALDTDILSDYPIDNCQVNAITPNHLAYVVYTSGSTGKPKGVLIEQQSVARLVCQNTWADFNESTICLQHSSISFDAATYELWAPLLNGGCLVVYDGIAGDGVGISQAINAYDVNSIFITSGLFAQWPETHATVPSLRHLMYGGEVISSDIVKTFYENNKELVISHVYGPTENTTFSTSHIVSRGFDPQLPVPIGQSISQSTAYVLNKSQQLVPTGALGELYVGGAGLARGYLNRPELTDEKFIVDPFSNDVSSRLYKTGDLVRRLPDGDIEFVGRVDNQVKIRGYRIELGEVESQLLAHEIVEQGVVLVREDSPGDKRLVAYSVLNKSPVENSEDSVSLLREHLSTVLPSYMVPSAYVVLDDLPLTVNGKVNRKALPAPEAGDFGQEEYIAPESETEKQLVNLWAELLNLDAADIGIHDNFFALGGHSLLAMRLQIQISSSFSVDISISQMFAKQTVALLAEFIESTEKDFSDDDLDWMNDLMDDLESVDEPVVEEA